MTNSSKTTIIMLSILAVGCSQGSYRNWAPPASDLNGGTRTLQTVMPSLPAEDSTITAGIQPAERLATKSGEVTTSDIERVSQITQDTQDPTRKIIYTARLTITVEKFDQLPDDVNRIVKDLGGYVSATRVDQMQGTQRRGSWTIRIPVDRYRDFLDSASGLGVPQSLTEDAQDVSAEFVDLQARVDSSKKLEQQIMQLLEKTTDKIDDLLSIERELSRVRLEIEQMEGRIRFLTNQVAMSTVYLTAQEQTTFVPSEKPSLDRRVQLEWSEAKGRTVRSLEDTLVWIVANTFVVLGWIVALLVLWIIYRRIRRAIRHRPAATAEAAAQ